MNQYVTGAIIKKLREGLGMTQAQLSEKINVSDKAISKWETGRGYPDISLLEPLAFALQISVIELLSGENVINTNRSVNMKKMKIYVCPVCGNIIVSSGETVVSCCGITLPFQEIEESDSEHCLEIQPSEDEYYVCCNHEMTKSHFISFIIAVNDDGYELVKLYPESLAQARFKISKTKFLYFYCNKHGLFKVSVKK